MTRHSEWQGQRLWWVLAVTVRVVRAERLITAFTDDISENNQRHSRHLACLATIKIYTHAFSLKSNAVSSLITLATKCCQSSLSSVALMSCVGFTLSFHRVHRLSKYFSLCHLLALLPSIFQLTTRFSKNSFSLRDQGNQAAFEEFFSLTYAVHLLPIVLPNYFSSQSMISLASSTKTRLQVSSTFHSSKDMQLLFKHWHCWQQPAPATSSGVMILAPLCIVRNVELRYCS